MQPPHQSSPTSPSRHPYACARCRTRKVKCDKIVPGCSKCSETRSECVYLARRPRQPRKVHVNQQTHHPSPTSRPLLPTESSRNNVTDDPTESSDESRSAGEENDRIIPREMRDSKFASKFDFNNSDRGRLFVARGKSRYIDSGKAHEVANLETVLAADPKSRDGETKSDRLSTSSARDIRGDHILLGMSGSMESLQRHYPPSEVITCLWDYYVSHVDPLVKVVYKPDVAAMITDASRAIRKIDASTESLLFAIWFASTMTMSPEECLTLQGQERDPLLRRYRYGLEKALSQAGWMTTQNIIILQALTLLIVFAPSPSARLNWMLIGMALSIAQSMGLHRDGTCFSLNPVETEVRRRVWWSLCQLDNRISLDCGLEPHIPLVTDTKLPLNINDSDLSLPNAELLTSQTNFTDTTLSLIKIEMAQLVLKIKRRQCETPSLSDEQVETLIHEKISRYESLYIPCLNKSFYMHRLCYLGVRLIITKLWKMIYDIAEHGKSAQNDAINDRLLSYHTDILEIAHQLPDTSRQFGWFFGCKYTQWHAMAYLMVRLCKHPEGPAVDRAWAVLDAVFSERNKEAQIPQEDNTGTRGPIPTSGLRHSLLKLLERARAARKGVVQHPHIQFPSDAPSALDSGYETSALTPSERSHLSPHDDGLLGDPFLGFGSNFGEEMNWNEIESWIQELYGEGDALNQVL